MIVLSIVFLILAVVFFLFYRIFKSNYEEYISSAKDRERSRYEEVPPKPYGWRIGYLISIGITVLFFLLSTFYVIDPGEVGIEVLFGTVQDTTENGFHGKNPFSSVVKWDIKTQKVSYEKVGSASEDLQQVIADITIQYRIDFTKLGNLYTKVGTDYETKIIDPGVVDSVKASTAKFKVEDIIKNRSELKKSIETSLKEKMSSFYLELQDLQIINIDFSPEFNKVVEDKQLEEQRIKTAEYRRQQAEKNKETKILEAQAEAENQKLLKQIQKPVFLLLQ